MRSLQICLLAAGVDKASLFFSTQTKYHDIVDVVVSVTNHAFLLIPLPDQNHPPLPPIGTIEPQENQPANPFNPTTQNPKIRPDPIFLIRYRVARRFRRKKKHGRTDRALPTRSQSQNIYIYPPAPPPPKKCSRTAPEGLHIKGILLTQPPFSLRVGLGP